MPVRSPVKRHTPVKFVNNQHLNFLNINKPMSAFIVPKEFLKLSKILFWFIIRTNGIPAIAQPEAVVISTLILHIMPEGATLFLCRLKIEYAPTVLPTE